MNRDEKLRILGSNPDLLIDLLSDIPFDILKTQRIKGKWSIHEHVCHLAEAQKMMLERFHAFKDIPNPVFKVYLPGTKDTPDDFLLEMDFDQSLNKFKNDRADIISYLKTFSEDDWLNRGIHPEYKMFTPDIFMRHIIMHDHLHMYRIEELWLTNDAFINN